jgi:uncharacterized protein YeaO (DUF488 family)
VGSAAPSAATPVAGKDYPRNFAEFIDWFHSEADAWAYVARRFRPDAEELNPDEQYAQLIHGEIVGYDREDDTEVRLGEVTFGRVDLDEIESAGDSLYEVLDSHSVEWESYASVIQEEQEDEDAFSMRALLFLDRVTLVPDARGHGLGLHVLARAIRTWGADDTLILLTASPTEREDEDDDEKVRVGQLALTRYWSRLRVEPVTDGDNVLIGRTWLAGIDRTIAALCEWESPATAE